MRLAGRGDLLRAGVGQHLLCAFYPVGVVAVHGEQYAAVAYAALVSLGLVLGDPDADETAGDAAESANHTDPAERGHDWARGHKRPDAWNHQGADANQPPQGSAKNGA